MLFEIKHRFTHKVLFSLECKSMKICLEAAVKAKTVLHGAALSYAALSYAALSYADLRGADLSYAALRGANLRGAALSYAALSYADLRDADFRDADLSYADLRDAALLPIRDDVFAVISTSPQEVRFLRDSIASGKIDGSVYEGECACLVGTLAKARHCNYTEIPGLKPNSYRPAEKWFLNIRKGDTPETNPSSKMALDWVDEWLAASGSPVEVK